MAETNWNLQAVDAGGSGISPWLSSTNKVSVEGYILNRGEYMLNGTPNYNTIPYNVGAQWQIFVQGGNGDHAGTCIWMGQNYQNLSYAGGVGRYTNEQWVNEIEKLTYDPRTGHRFMPGDKVRVTGLTKFYGGKTNINERHNADLAYDIMIELVELGAGLPQPQVVTLDQLKDSSDNFIFDPNRTTGCEYYQAQLIRVNNVSFVNPALWAPNTTLTITDGTRTFPVLLGIGPGITTTSNNLNSTFDVIGILDQEDGSAPNTAGYRIWVTNYDGNGQILTDGCDLNGVFSSGDINKDCIVDLKDFAILSREWLSCSNLFLSECQ
jgi:hypothetical protein